jgi:hypothetical protein
VAAAGLAGEIRPASAETAARASPNAPMRTIRER